MTIDGRVAQATDSDRSAAAPEPRVTTDEIAETVRRLFVEASRGITPEARAAFAAARRQEQSALARSVLDQILENARIARREGIPYCQDTGMATVFVRRGARVRIVGGTLSNAIQEGVRASFVHGYLRASVVADPLRRTNTGDNTPAIVHVEEVEHDELTIWVMPRGFGGENTSRLAILTPADGWPGVVREVVETVRLAGPNACPPLIVGVGIGGNFEYAPYLAKRALLRRVGRPHPDPYLAERERELLAAINATGLGAGGLGGTITAVAVHVEVFPTHISSLPVAVNLGCHAHRIGRATLIGRSDE